MITIALSKATGSPKYAHYAEWLKATDAEISIIDLWGKPIEECLGILENVHGLVLTGGADIHPERYGKPERISECHLEPERDTHEFALFEKAQELLLPILAICRGAQLVNVALGGTLYIDIPTDYVADTEHRSKDGIDSTHGLHVEAGSLLRKISKSDNGSINSAHHQAVEYLSPLLRKSALSEDGLIEAFEWNVLHGRGFLLGVQWHPERMDYTNPFSLPIAQHFLYEAESYQLLVQGVKKIIDSE